MQYTAFPEKQFKLNENAPWLNKVSSSSLSLAFSLSLSLFLSISLSLFFFSLCRFLVYDLVSNLIRYWT